MPMSEDKLESTLDSGDDNGGELTEGTALTMAASKTATEGSSLAAELSLLLL